MNTRSNKELVFGHSILRSWAKKGYAGKPSNWSEKDIGVEHSRLVGVMKKRGIHHKTPLS